MKYSLKDKWLRIEIASLFVDNIQAFFDAYIPSKKIQHLLIQNKKILIDGNSVKRESDLAGQYLEIEIYNESLEKEELKYKLDVVYEDPLIIVVNKPKDLLVHSDGNGELSLQDIVSNYYKEDYILPKPIHRLDKETSGLVLFSKSPIFQPVFDKLLEEKKIRRTYLAFVKGKRKPGEQFKVDNNIGRDRHNSKKMAIVKNGGQRAISKYRVIGSSNNLSVIECNLESGRTHQIRLQLSNLNLPILNDELYGVSSKEIKRMGLVASDLELYHPILEEMINLEVDLPNDLLELFNNLVN